MTPRELWERYRAMLLDEPALGFRLDLSRMGFGERELEEREGAIGRALAAMAALERRSDRQPRREPDGRALLAARAGTRAHAGNRRGDPRNA